MSKWDSQIPKTPRDVILLLERRIEVHTYWRDYCIEGSKRAKSCEEHGVGSAESHQTYIDQYKGAIRVIETGFKVPR